MGGRRAAVRAGDRHGRAAEPVPQTDGSVGRPARRADADDPVASRRQAGRRQTADLPGPLRRERERTLMFDSSFDAIVPMLCVTLSALAVMIAESFRGKDER